MRFFCADFCADFAPILRRFWHFAPILRRFLTQKVGLRPKSWTSSSLNGKTGNPFIYWEFPIFLGWVPGRTRTVDIQNHKQLHRFSAIPFVHRCFRGLRKPCLRLFCGYLYFELKFAKSFPFLILHFLTAICKQTLLDLIAFFKAFFESFFKLSFAALFQFQQ